MSNIKQQVIDFSLTNGLIKYNQKFQLVHAPLSLTPHTIPRSVEQHLRALTPIFNQLILRVSQNTDFLKEQLEEAAQTDPFVDKLLKLYVQFPDPQPLQLLINRNDYMLVAEQGTLQPKQVEFNTISVSFPFLSSKINALHKYLQQLPNFQAVVPTNPLKGVANALANAVIHYDVSNTCVLIVIQDHEKNVFDQRGLEYKLWEKHHIPCLRLTLEEIANHGKLKEGHLSINGQIAAITYLRAAYTPNDFHSPLTWKGRELIEASSTIKVPNLGMQLAGMKKIQQSLGQEMVLKRFVEPEHLQKVKNTFVGQHLLNEVISTPLGNVLAKDLACQEPHKYVLKPQREGGGNNFFDNELVQKIQSLSKEEELAYILMERIDAIVHSATLMVEGNPQEKECISEIGQFGIAMAQGSEILENKDVGYLVRTKASDENEGGVSMGYSCLNSLSLSD